MSLLERVQADIDRGDLGSARRRLASYIGSVGYSPDVLAKVAEVSMQMRDPVQAGRYWMLTPATGPVVEQAITAFVLACHHNAQQLASELPRFKLRYRLIDYPEVVHERLARFGIDAVFKEQDPELMPQRVGWKHNVKALGCLAIALAFSALIFVVVRLVVRRLCG